MKNTRFVALCLITILVVTANINAQTVDTLHIVEEDYATGSVWGDLALQNSQGDIEVGYEWWDTYTGYARFSLSAIPEGAEILSVTLHASTTEISNYTIEMRQLTIVPDAINAMDVSADIISGDIFATGWTGMQGLGWHDIEFFEGGVDNFQEAVDAGDDWFGGE